MSDGMSDAYRQQQRNEQAMRELETLASYLRNACPERFDDAVEAIRNMYKVPPQRAEVILNELVAMRLVTWVRFLTILNHDPREPFLPLSPFAGKVVRVARCGEESAEYVAALKALPGVDIHEVELPCFGRYRLIALPKP